MKFDKLHAMKTFTLISSFLLAAVATVWGQNYDDVYYQPSGGNSSSQDQYYDNGNQYNNSGDNSYKFIAVRLPYETQFDEIDATASVDFIEPDERHTVNIGPAVKALAHEVAAFEGKAAVSRDFVLGNTKARMRMVAQYTIAGAAGGLDSAELTLSLSSVLERGGKLDARRAEDIYARAQAQRASFNLL